MIITPGTSPAYFKMIGKLRHPVPKLLTRKSKIASLKSFSSALQTTGSVDMLFLLLLEDSLMFSFFLDRLIEAL